MLWKKTGLFWKNGDYRTPNEKPLVFGDAVKHFRKSPGLSRLKMKPRTPGRILRLMRII